MSDRTDATGEHDPQDRQHEWREAVQSHGREHAHYARRLLAANQEFLAAVISRDAFLVWGPDAEWQTSGDLSARDDNVRAAHDKIWRLAGESVTDVLIRVRNLARNFPDGFPDTMLIESTEALDEQSAILKLTAGKTRTLVERMLSVTSYYTDEAGEQRDHDAVRRCERLYDEAGKAFELVHTAFKGQDNYLRQLQRWDLASQSFTPNSTQSGLGALLDAIAQAGDVEVRTVDLSNSGSVSQFITDVIKSL